eukprot:scaffold70208_cov26-Tisochrysis_lutea.AAC.2
MPNQGRRGPGALMEASASESKGRGRKSKRPASSLVPSVRSSTQALARARRARTVGEHLNGPRIGDAPHQQRRVDALGTEAVAYACGGKLRQRCGHTHRSSRCEQGGLGVSQRARLVAKVHLRPVHRQGLGQEGLDVRQRGFEPREQQAQPLVVGEVKGHTGGDRSVLHFDRDGRTATQAAAVHLPITGVRGEGGRWVACACGFRDERAARRQRGAPRACAIEALEMGSASISAMPSTPTSPSSATNVSSTSASGSVALESSRALSSRTRGAGIASARVARNCPTLTHSPPSGCMCRLSAVPMRPSNLAAAAEAAAESSPSRRLARATAMRRRRRSK